MRRSFVLVLLAVTAAVSCSPTRGQLLARASVRTPTHSSSTPTPSSQPQAINPVVPGFEPNSVAFWTPAHGPVGGLMHCPGCGKKGVGAVAETWNGGRIWRVVYRGGSQVDGLAVRGRAEAWATDSGDLIHTVDGGRTWETLFSREASIDPPSRPPRSAGRLLEASTPKIQPTSWAQLTVGLPGSPCPIHAVIWAQGSA